VLNLVVGSGRKVGNELINAKKVCGISFTGSNEVGKQIEQAALENGTKLCCELGGKNPCVILADADLDAALAGVLKGAFGASGQRCTATSRLIVEESIADEFAARVAEGANALKVGHGINDNVDMGPVIDQSQLDTVLGFIESAKKDGFDLKAGGERVTENDLDKGFFVRPTVFDKVDQNSYIAQEEVFGPVLSIIRAKDYDHAVEISNNTQYGLSSAIYTSNINTAMRFSDDIEAGMVHINSPTLGGEAQVPFGGIKASGIGDREMAKEGLHFFTELKTVFVDYSGGARKSNIY
jgi:aldehyde dehydrogenase (NAD+)